MNDVAIIGYSYRCSDISSDSEFIDLLKNKNHCIGQPAGERLQFSGKSPDSQYYPYGYLNKVDEFDHEFFNLSKTEADAIDPAHRLLLEETFLAVQNSGIALQELDGARTGLFISVSHSLYNIIYNSPNKDLDFIGSLPSMAAARIANFFNIRGPVINIDTACSSTLVAIHEATQKIKNNEIDIAIVGGARVLYDFVEKNEIVQDAILDKDGVCRAFDETAAGTSGGEGVAVIVLKRLESAIKDKNQIHTIIKGSAINHDGKTSNGLTAPSPSAQTQVILEACNNANISFENISYIETHGTGTKLGDPIEYKAIQNVISKTNKNNPVYLGTLKPNIGHLDNVSGIFGLIKTIFVLKDRKVFPLTHFSKLNNFIIPDEKIILPTHSQTFRSEETILAGVSSFGLSGTNAHIIVQEYQENKHSYMVSPIKSLCYSAKTENSLALLEKKIRERLDTTPEHKVDLFCSSLNKIFVKNNYNKHIIGKDKNDLIQKLAENEITTDRDKKKIILLFLSNIVETEMIAETDENYFSNYLSREKEKLKGNIGFPHLDAVAYQVAVYRCLKDLGFNIDTLIHNGTLGSYSKSVIENSVNKAELLKNDSTPINLERFRIFIQQNNLSNSHIIIIDPVINEDLNSLLKNAGIPYTYLSYRDSSSIHNLWQSVFEHDLVSNFQNIYTGIGLPHYPLNIDPFNKVSCWNPIKSSFINGPAKTNDTFLPKENIETHVLHLLKKILQANEISLEDDFFDLGGNSILGIQFINEINSSYKLELSFESILDLYSIREIILYIEKEAEKQIPLPISTVPPGDMSEIPSNAQKRMWIESQNPMISLGYNIHMNFKVKGNFDKNILQRALTEVVKKHESLRTVFPINEKGTLLRVIKPWEEINIETIFKETENGRKDLFDLTEGPLFNCFLLKEQDTYTLKFTFHHIIFDGWSAGVFVSDLVKVYQDLSENIFIEDLEIPAGYSKYITWLDDKIKNEKYLQYKDEWKSKLKNINKSLKIGANDSSLLSNAGKRISVKFPQQLYSHILNFCTENKYTLFTILLTSIRSYLFRLTNENLIIGVPISGRSKKEFENLIGLFVNSIPVYTDLSDQDNFEKAISKEFGSLKHAYEFQDLPLDMLTEYLGLEGGEQLFNIMVVLQNQNSRNNLAIKVQKDLEISPYADGYHDDIFTRFDVSFNFFDSEDSLELELEYKTDLFESNFIENFIKNYFFYFENLLTRKESMINDEQVVREEEAKLILNYGMGNKTVSSFKNILEAFDLQVHKNPDAVAIEFQDKRVTYQELYSTSLKIAGYLKNELKIVENSFIGVCMNRSEWMIISIMGILRNGCAYIPIDINTPQQRFDHIISDSNCKYVLDNKFILEKPFFNQHEFSISEYTPGVDAYAIYTSGTTGIPKGVKISMESLSDYCSNFIDYFSLEKQHAMISQATIAFDTSIEEIFPILLVGGRLIISEDTKNFDLIYTLCEKHHITHISTNPYTILYLNDNRDLYPSLGLKTIITGGDILQPEFISNISDEFDIYNTYGPTEGTVCATYYKIEKPFNKKTIPIGRPINNKNVYILKNNKIVPIGIYGEICIGGGLSSGYINNSQLTAEKFITNPLKSDEIIYKTGDMAKWNFHGEIEFLGRIDEQVKIRGHRIELKEIESKILEFNAEYEFVYVTVDLLNEEKVLAAHILCREKIDTPDLLSFLKQHLPSYMIPFGFIRLDTLPLTVNGKLDKNKLKKISIDDIPRKLFNPPVTDVQKKLSDIWGNVLSVPEISIDENFFDIGGNSINAVKVIAQINNLFTTKYPLDMLFHVNTIKEISFYIDHNYDFNKEYYEYGDPLLDRKIFAMPPILGYGTAYKNLFSETKNAHIIAFNFLDNINNEDIVPHYSKIISDMAKNEDIILFGWSAGGNLSYEIACYIEKYMDKKVSDIIMLDSYATPVDIKEIDEFNEIDNIFIHYDSDLEKLYKNDNIMLSAREKVLKYLKYLYEIEYRKKCSSNLLLIKSSEPMDDYGWEHLFPEINIYEGHGEHYVMLEEQFIEPNKKIIRQIINEIL